MVGILDLYVIDLQDDIYRQVVNTGDELPSMTEKLWSCVIGFEHTGLHHRGNRIDQFHLHPGATFPLNRTISDFSSDPA